jgi:ribosomal-protein-alanine N-acetyltransferase
VLQIRQAGETDINHLMTLEQECFTAHYYEPHKFGELNFQDYLRDKKSVFFVAVDHSDVAGYVAGSVRSSRLRSVAHLDSIAVRPSVRDKGVGRQLLDHFIQEAKRRACGAVELEVAKANEQGLAFFCERGFSQVGELTHYYGRGLDGVLMQLRI